MKDCRIPERDIMRMKIRLDVLIFALLIVLCTDRALLGSEEGAEEKEFKLHLDEFKDSFDTCLDQRNAIRRLRDELTAGGSDDVRNIETFKVLVKSYKTMISSIAEAEAKMDDVLIKLELYMNKFKDTGKTPYEKIREKGYKDIRSDLDKMKAENKPESILSAFEKVFRMSKASHDLFNKLSKDAMRGDLEAIKGLKNGLELFKDVLQFSRKLDKVQCAKFENVVRSMERQIEAEEMLEKLFGDGGIDKWLKNMFDDVFEMDRLNDILGKLIRGKSDKDKRMLEKMIFGKIDESDINPVEKIEIWVAYRKRPDADIARADERIGYWTDKSDADPRDKVKLWEEYKKRPDADGTKADERIDYWSSKLRTCGKTLSCDDIKNLYNTSDIKEMGSGFIVNPEAPTIFKIEGKYSRVVTDHAHELMWQRSCSLEKMNRKDAVDYAGGLKFENFSDWRLPTVDEAITILKGYGRRGESLDDVFRNKNALRIWTLDRKDDKNSWYIDFLGGKRIANLTFGANSKKLHVRVVRSIPPDQ